MGNPDGEGMGLRAPTGPRQDNRATLILRSITATRCSLWPVDHRACSNRPSYAAVFEKYLCEHTLPFGWGGVASP